MAQSLSQLYVNIVFSTKKRFPFIKQEIEKELFAYIGGVIKNNGGIPFMINGVSDHIHIFASLPKTIALSKYIANQKKHHKQQTYKEEVLQFLKKYNIDYDENYLWD